jgi:hypothetical protein
VGEAASHTRLWAPGASARPRNPSFRPRRLKSLSRATPAPQHPSNTHLLNPQDVEYGIYPRKYQLFCRDYAHGGGPIRGPRAARAPAGLLGTPVLPDLSKEDWVAAGVVDVSPGREAVMWRLTKKQEAGEKLDQYYFLVTRDVSFQRGASPR